MLLDRPLRPPSLRLGTLGLHGFFEAHAGPCFILCSVRVLLSPSPNCRTIYHAFDPPIRRTLSVDSPLLIFTSDVCIFLVVERLSSSSVSWF